MDQSLPQSELQVSRAKQGSNRIISRFLAALIWCSGSHVSCCPVCLFLLCLCVASSGDLSSACISREPGFRFSSCPLPRVTPHAWARRSPLARSIPLFPLTRSAAGACESGEVQGGFSAGLSGDPDQCQAERLAGHAQHSPMSFFVLAPLFPLPRTPALPFPNPCQNPVHLFQVFAPMPASSPQSPR